MSLDPSQTALPPTELRRKAVQILARSLFRELTSQGYTARQIVGLATALLGEVTATLARRSEAR